MEYILLQQKNCVNLSFAGVTEQENKTKPFSMGGFIH
jgi:hypothetical protein